MEAEEVCEWMQGVIEDLIEEYRCNNNISSDFRNGALEALKEMLEILKE